MGAARLFGEPVHDIARGKGFALGFDERLALFQRHDLADLVGAAADDIGGLAQRLVAIESGTLLPRPEPLPGRRPSADEVTLVGVRPLPALLAGDRFHTHRAERKS